MAAFSPLSQPSNIGPAGLTSTIIIPAGYRRSRVARVIVAHISGGLQYYSVYISTDPLVLDPLVAIASYPHLDPLEVLDDDNGNEGFPWDGEDPEEWWTNLPKNIYVRITPDMGLNDFSVSLYLEPS